MGTGSNLAFGCFNVIWQFACGISIVVGVVLMVLNGVEVIQWPWWQASAPVWVPFALWPVIAVMLTVFKDDE